MSIITSLCFCVTQPCASRKKVTHEKKADIKQLTEITKGDADRADHSKMLNIFNTDWGHQEKRGHLKRRSHFII